MQNITKQYDVVVVGGGLSGVCAALAAARHGAHTALLQNRQVLGGNASSEVRVNISGAARDGKIADAAETGILEEILLDNKAINPQNSFSVFDMLLWEKVHFQENLNLYLNTSLLSTQTEGNRICTVAALQSTTETLFTFAAKLFVDTTGDAVLAAEAGADWTIGREAYSEYQEPHAPLTADLHTMGSTILFSTKDTGAPVSYHRPDWAHEFTREMLKSRAINEVTHGYWWVELGGDDLRVIEDGETIRDELFKWVLGVFDFIKNSGDYDTENLVLDWICTVPGRRESRRILGDYVLNEHDVYLARRFEDAVAYGGWTMDNHSIGGICAKNEGEQGTTWLPIEGIYTIPYRCLYSRNIENLYVGGRAISATHMALSSARVMATCAVVGQAIGTAAALAVAHGESPRMLGKVHMDLLQQTLIRDDCYLPGIRRQDVNDLLQTNSCIVKTSAATPGGAGENVLNGLTRRIGEAENAWISPMDSAPVWISFDFEKAVEIQQLELIFDPDLTNPIMPTMCLPLIAGQPKKQPKTLVRDYTLSLWRDGKMVWREQIKDNLQRVAITTLSKTVCCECIKIEVEQTYGDLFARIFEVRAYGKCDSNPCKTY